MQVLEQVAKEHRDKLRCIIFVQDRVTTHILEYILNRRSSDLIQSLSTACIYATNSPVSQQFRVNKSQANSRIEKFARGDVTVLISTSFAEEGLDIQVRMLSKFYFSFEFEFESLLPDAEFWTFSRLEWSSFFVVIEEVTYMLCRLRTA